MTKSLTSADLPLKPPAKVFKGLGSCRQYAVSEVSSDGSKWKAALLKDATKQGLAAKGLLKNDITYAHANTPAVCVTRTMSLPQVPPPAGQEAICKFLKKSISRCEKEDRRARKAFAEGQTLRETPSADQGSSEVLPKQMRKTAGKPAITRPIAPTGEAMASMMNAEDSHFTTEYRSNGWWKTVGDMRELKEHVRPYDSWTLFRDNAASVNKFSRYPINTY